jgi:hypothetical protein
MSDNARGGNVLISEDEIALGSVLDKLVRITIARIIDKWNYARRLIGLSKVV